jgi:histidinol-phosphate aminotransferase
MSVLDLARPELVSMQPYSSARMEAGAGSVWLNANESPWSPGERDQLNRYPEPQPSKLIAALSALYGVGAEQVFAGRGSDEAIDLLTRAFCAAGRSNVVIAPPTFGMYAIAAQIQGAVVRSVPLLRAAGYRLDADALLAAVDAGTRLVYVCTPNNPTGNAIDAATLERLATALRDRALLVVDEAYAEFALAPGATAMLARHDHVVVLRTLSKAHGLAAARVGVALAAAPVIGLLRRIMPPYPLPSPCVDAALAALQPAALARTRDRVAATVAERERVRGALAGAPGVIEVLPSSANFLTARFTDAERAYAELFAAGVVVRSLRRYAGLENALRITIGTPEENAAVLAILGGERRAA